jgi:hypothetical protein
MTLDEPTDAEQAEIDAFQNGVYGAEPPEWWLNRATAHDIIPDGSADERGSCCRYSSPVPCNGCPDV